MAKVLITEDYLSDIGDAIRGKLGVSSHYTPGQMASAIGRIPVVSPTLISKTILSNGTYNASEDEADGYDNVSVDVPNSYSAADEGKVVSSGALVSQGIMSVSSNSIYDTTLFSQVSVAIPAASLISKTISENGTYDPIDDNADAYSQVVVDVPSGGGGGQDAINWKIAIGVSTGALIDDEITSIPSGAFSNHGMSCNNSITGVSFKNVTDVNEYAFNSCPRISYISLPNCKMISGYAFFSCLDISSIIFPNCETMKSNAFAFCTSLSFVSLPKCKSLIGPVFQYNTSLNTVILNSLEKISGSSTFKKCQALESLYILASSVATLERYNVFDSTPMSISTYLGHFGSIFVPESLVSNYKGANNWSAYADRITAYVEE